MEFNPDIYPDMRFDKGPLIAGLVFISLLFGASVVSFFSYLQFSLPSDRKGIRILAFTMAGFAVITMTFSVVRSLRGFAFRYGSEPNLVDAQFDSASFLLGGVAHVLAGGFFAHRAWKIYDRPIILGVILSLFILTTSVGAIGAAVTGMASDVRSGREDIFNYLLFISVMVGDITITLLITIKLWRSKTGWARTDSLMNNLVILAIEAQVPPALTAIAFIITYVGAPHESYTLAFSCIPMVYVLSLFAALQSRHTISVKMGPTTMQDYSVPSRTLPTSLHVTTETYSHATVMEMGVVKVRGGGRLAESSESLQDEQHENKDDYNTSEVRLV